MKRRSRFLALLCAAVMMAFVLAGCSKPNAETPNPDDQNPPDETNTQTYAIASDNSFAPFEFLDTDTNKYIGVDMDILAAVAEDQNFKYTVDNVGFDPATGLVKAGQADGVIAGMSITEDRQLEYDFSDAYYEDGQIMVVAGDSDIASLEALSGQVVAAKTSTMGATYAESVKDQYGFQVVYYEDSPTMYQAVMNGTNAACFEDRSVVEFAISKENLSLKTVGETINPKDYGFAVAKGKNAELLKLFNAGLQNIKDNGKYDEILAKYGLGK